MALDREQIENWDASPWRVEDKRLVVGEGETARSVPADDFGHLILALVQAMKNR